jgi:anti-sigma B factor antagonist
MDISTKLENGIAVLAVAGSLDALTAPDLATALTQQLDAGNLKVVVDLAELDYTSSAGLRALLSGAKEARARGGDLRLAGAKPTVQRVFDLSGFTSVLNIYPDVATSITGF